MNVGFYVEDGILKENGVAIKEFGINCPDLFMRWLGNSTPSLAPSSSSPIQYQTNYATNIDTLTGLGFRVIRFNLFGFRTLTYQKSWVEQNATFLTNLDALVAYAESKGVRLIPDLFWQPSLMPPYYSEGLSAIGDSASLTRAAMAGIINVIVGRYKDSPAIAMWSFGNEYDGLIGNNGFFQTNSSPTPDNGLSTDATMGQPATWTYPKDGHTQETIYNAMDFFQSSVKALDPTRATISGNQGYRNRKIKKVLAEFLAERAMDDRCDCLSAHTYEFSDYYNADYLGYELFLDRYKAFGKSVGKPFIVHEFGVPRRSDGNTTTGRLASQQQMRVTAAIASAEVQLALLWCYPGIAGTDVTVSFRADEPSANRGAELQWLSDFNKMYKAT